MVSFAVLKLLSLTRPHLFIFAFVSFALGDRSPKMMLWFMSKSVLPVFSYSASECLCKEKEKTNLKIYMYPSVSVLSHSIVPDSFVTPWIIACQAPPSMEFSRQEYWGGLLFPTPGHLPAPGIEPVSPVSPALQVDSLLLSHQRSPIHWLYVCFSKNVICQFF